MWAEQTEELGRSLEVGTLGLPGAGADMMKWYPPMWLD